jgi:hypothetical protein
VSDTAPRTLVDAIDASLKQALRTPDGVAPPTAAVDRRRRTVGAVDSHYAEGSAAALRTRRLCTPRNVAG